MAGAALSAGTLLASQGRAQSSSSERELSKDDVALLQFALWAEIVESDLWTQYAELGEQRKNPDLGAAFKGPFVITNQPAIPLNDTDTPPTTNPTIPITGRDAQRLQAIANTAGFHFAFIEQRGASLYPTLAFKATDPTVLRILVSIGGVRDRPNVSGSKQSCDRAHPNQQDPA
jgi:hypothetical protein